MPRRQDPDAWVDTAISTRRFPKKGVHRRGSSDSSKSAFNPSSLFGTYAIKCPILSTANAKHTSSSSSPAPSAEQMSFTIHNLVTNSETGEPMEGLVASFDFGVLRGMALVGGSRRGLREVVSTVEAEEEAEIERIRSREEEEEGREREKYERVYKPVSDDEDEGDEDGDDDDEDGEGEGLRRVPSSPTTSRNALFEKNTFRHPKFFFEWRGFDALASSNVSRGPRSDCMGHLEFANASCKEFKGTFSSERWGENVAFEGWKVRSGGGKTGECPYAWGMFDESADADGGGE